MELRTKTISTCEIKSKGTVQAMTDGDVIVPDTKPDILKLLQVDADASITDKYIENGRLIICGRVNYKILYVPDKENEQIKSMLTSMEFRQVVDIGNADIDLKILTKPMVERVEFDAINSRKLRLRAIIHVDYEVYEVKEIEFSSDIECDNAEKKSKHIEFERNVNVSEHDFTIKEKLEVVNGERAINEILKTDVRICDTEYKSVTGKVIIKGVACICVLYTDEEGEIKFIESESPFTEVLDAEGVSDESICDIDYCLLGVMSTAEPDIDGDLREIVIDIDVCASLKASENVEEDVLVDCFMPYVKTNYTAEEITLKSTIERPCSQNTIREIAELPQNAPGIAGVYNIMTNAIITKSELQHNKIICEGKLETYILYLTDNRENPIYSLKKEIPFSYMIECKNDNPDLNCEIKCTVTHASYNLTSGGEIEIRCLLSIECMLIREITIDNIIEVETIDSDARQGIIIYFASAGEDVWDIAKRYGVPCATIINYNEIESDKIEKERKLFIPMR